MKAPILPVSAACIASPASGRRSKVQASGIVLMMIAMACLVAIEALHGHKCMDGTCLLCLAAGFANVILVLSLGALLAQPAIQVLSELLLTAPIAVPFFLAPCTASTRTTAIRPESTPVSLRVKLII